MNNFYDRWNNEEKFQTKIKLALYLLFIIVVTIYAAFANKNNLNINLNTNLDYNKEYSDVNETLNIDSKTVKMIIVEINDSTVEYMFEGNKITKIEQSITTNYIVEDDKYYKEDGQNFKYISKSEVFNNIDSDYLNISNINNYLELSTKVDDSKYEIMIKDIILNANTFDKIYVVSHSDGTIEIDYSKLMSYLDDKDINCVVKIVQ